MSTTKDGSRAFSRSSERSAQERRDMGRWPSIIAVLAVAIAALLGGGRSPARADDQADTDFAKRMFAADAGKTKSYACFVRRYDAQHLAEHPLQKVSLMKLLITAEHTEDDTHLNYSFRLGVNFRNK